ncbi:interferon-induced GTP-binding protein MxB [Oncorhynchus mykiss]|uniref:Uncharacterized protein n=1 Tax=Oncorhynchus mykiss TaxID=8022 RepID=A0A8C7W619_ONCMY|nr:interferon-induced GTP-binding protein MxB [Oncorhynchus mykiss]
MSDDEDGPSMFQDQLAKKVRPFIELIDYLRSIGIEKELPLPSIAVVGDQSSGKSSVLEALSGVALPRGNGIVTRCPLELRLCYVSGVVWKAVISYKNKTFEFDDREEVARHVEQAQNELAGRGVGICEDLITLKIKSSTVCDLRLIDLPGIARVPVPGQPEDIEAQIKSLIMKYISKKKTINLVVIPCYNDIATTEALKMVQKVDPEGTRTLAILTKPDLIDKGTEKDVLEIVRNKTLPLNMGYVIVKCRGQKQIDDKMSIAQALEEELDFFQDHEHFKSLLLEERATTKHLATKLTYTLVNHIKKSLPDMSNQIKKQLWNVRKALVECEGGPPSDLAERKEFLIGIITEFNEKITRLSTGDNTVEENIFVLMRSEFADWMKSLQNAKPTYHEVVQQVVDEYDLKHRGSELPGFTNYMVFKRVVQRLVAKLREPAMMTLQKIREMVHTQFVNLSKVSFENFPYLQHVSMKNIENIQEWQSNIVMKRIEEQFQMEMQVYTQDEIFFETLNPEEETPDCSGYDTRNKYPELLKAYYEIVVQRLADQVPMLIRYFILKESARILCSKMLGLLNSDDLDEMLTEESEIGRRRSALRSRVERLGLANDKISSL